MYLANEASKSNLPQESHLNLTNKFSASTLRRHAIEAFASKFASLGYQEHQPGQIIPTYDKSVYFLGSTISTLKPFLVESIIPESGLYITQKCLRTQNIKLPVDFSAYPRFASYFTSVGVLLPYSGLNRLASDALSYLSGLFSRAEERLVIRANSKDEDILNSLLPVLGSTKLVLDTEPSKYYTHAFGIPGTTGRNANIGVLNPVTGQVRDFCNLIVIKTEKEKLGVEFSVGVETMVTGFLGLDHPIQACPISELYMPRSAQEVRLIDCLATAVVIGNAGVRPVASDGRGRVLRTCLQSIGKLVELSKFDLALLESTTNDFEHVEFDRAPLIAKSVIQYVRRYLELTKAGNLSSEKLNEQLTKECFEAL